MFIVNFLILVWKREAKFNTSAFAFFAFELNLTVMQSHAVFDDRKPQTSTADLFGVAFIDAVEAFKDTFLVSFGNADAVVLDLNDSIIFRFGNGEMHKTAGVIIFDSVIAEVIDNFFENSGNADNIDGFSLTGQ